MPSFSVRPANLSSGAVPLRRAGGADSIQKKFVTCGPEPSGQARFDLRLAAFEFIEIATIVAMEMVMMPFAGNFVAG